ncbi:branched-chain amino acid transport protein, AzlD family [Campylobacter mucosalis CCUG 21559]|uniref:Branched-chain amino acid transport protein, AzlD family n=1 Tax=Campylobacter mucosalis CCUG 21559 TaxID=1032067 RepID=A0A6G5QH02_9BACT|nr:branched-chain amino acid transport protein, AzlD family [Campylobacter mucosalis CCUG 21559]
MFLAVLASAAATFLTRILPFYAMKNYKPKLWLEATQRDMGLMIMVVLVCYGLKDTKFNVYPYGLNEILAVLTAILVHLKFKNALLSIVVSTAVFMFCLRIF